MNGKQLKNSILQWAIQGKLVPQDPNDEPASVLLEKIRAEKARLVKEGKLKKDKNESIIYRGDDNSYYEKFAGGKVKCIDEEIPFEIPSSWIWERWGNISFSILYGYNAPAEAKGDVRMVRISDIQNNKVLWNTVPFCKIKKQDIDTYLLKPNDILFARTGGTVGKSYIVTDVPYPSIFAGYLIRTQYSTQLCPQYLKFFMESPLYWDELKEGTTATAQPNCNGKKLASMLLPIPPIEEQYRIVDKLNGLFSIVNRYNIAQDHLDTLNNSIKHLLKKSILQEAIQGNLVKQCSNDEPAPILLERIKLEKHKLVKAGNLKAKDITESTIFKGDDNKYYEKCEKATSCIDTEIPFDIPDNWNWCRLGDLIYTKTGLAYSKPNLDIKSEKMIRVLRGGNIGYGFWNMKSDDVMISNEFVKSDLYLRKGYFITPAVTSWENMGKTALVREDYNDVVVGGFVLMMCPYYTDGIIEEYLNCFFQSVLFQQYCRSITNKSGQAFYNLSRNKLLQLLIPIPPTEEQKRIFAKFDKATASIMSR